MADTPRVTVPVEELAGKLKAIRDKFLMPTPDKDFTDYAVMTRCIDALSAAPAPEGGAVAMIKALLDHIDRETCQHDNLKRGGFQWTICEDCDRKWADDQGGFKPYADAPPVAAARLYLEALAALQAEQGAK